MALAASLTATTSPLVAGTVTYAEGATPVTAATVLSAGAHSILATFAPTDAVNYTTATVTPTITVTAATPTLTWTPTTPIVYGASLGGSLTATTSPLVAGTVAYAEGATAVTAATVLGAGAHTILATFTPADAVNYTTATVTATITVTAATPTLTWTPATPIVYGTPLAGSLTATTTPLVAGTVTYAEGATALTAATVLGAGAHTLTATFTPADAVNYTTAAVTATITVTPATPTLTWTPTTPIVYATSLAGSLTATTSPLVAGTVTYAEGATAVTAATVLGAGAHTLTATFTPADAVNYTTATVTAAITVTAATPTLTWTPTTPIVYGTSLAASLTATTSP